MKDILIVGLVGLLSEIMVSDGGELITTVLFMLMLTVAIARVQRAQAKWRNFYQASGGKMYVVCDNRSCMRNIRSEINYCLGNKPLVVSLTNLADL